MESSIDAIALFAVVGVSMATSLTLVIRALAREFGARGGDSG